MTKSEKNFREYYKSGQYNDFYKLKERSSPLTGHIHITFTNGINKVTASGRFKEAALEKIFARIDNLSSVKKSTTVNSESSTVLS